MKLENYKHITSHSKKVKKDSIFVSLNNNIEYINEAIKNKASVIVLNKTLQINHNTLIVNNIEYFFSYWYQKINKINIDDFTTIAITGTDGKTTVSKMVYDTIKERYKAIYIGTIGIYLDGEIVQTKNTTPDIETILETFVYAKNNKIKYIILEASSEGLLSKRLIGIRFNVVVFTNLSHEHLNTHKTMEGYFKSKKILLKLLKENGVAITNIEDIYGMKFKSRNTINYGLHKGNVHTLSFTFVKDFTIILLTNNNQYFYYKIPFIGIYNIYNFLAVHAVISYLFNIKNFKFNNLTPPSGRFLIINNNIIIDFAHTPNALENLLLTITEIYKNKKIILVIGAQGGKDKSKRKLLGSVASKYCSTTILTSEDPKNESVLDIILDISSGFFKSNYLIELNRKNAIIKGIKIQDEDSILVITGKGLEETETHKNIVLKHSDYDCVMQELKK